MTRQGSGTAAGGIESGRDESRPYGGKAPRAQTYGAVRLVGI